MRYITRDQFFLLNTDYPNWQQQSFENLRNSTDNFYTNFRTDVETNALSCIIFSNNDGIGSSRILLSNELEKGFPEGYHVAMPDRAFGLVISKNISSTEEQNITNIIAEYYGCTGTAMSDYIMDKTDFSLPNSWTLTIDKKISDWIVDEIKEYKNN